MKEEEKLASREFWVNYWSGIKPAVVNSIDFEKFFSGLPQGSELIEIGGFPGRYPIFLKKKFNYNITIFDYVIIPEIIDRMCVANDLPEKSFPVIEGDFFTYDPEKQFDLVFSIGFIEHFENTAEVIQRHLPFVKPGGRLVITLPNFRGINGCVQKTLDKSLYRAHNIGIMNVKKLSSICEQCGFKDFKVFYSEKPRLWMDKTARGGFLIRGMVSWLSRFISIFHTKKGSRLFSPFIVITATR
jgi:SAM-dependent methyltransferase